MSSPTEFNKKVELSIGAIVFIIALTFSATKIYSSLATLESRMDKRNERLLDMQSELKERLESVDQRLLELEKK